MDQEAVILRDEALYTDRWTCAYLGVDRRTLAAWRAAGKIKALHLSRRCLRYRGSETRAFLERATQEARS